MLTSKAVVFNTSMQVIGRIISGIFSFLALLILAQTLGAFYYGEYTKATTYIIFFYMMIDFGINAIYLREAGDKAKTNFPMLLGLRICLGAVLAAIAISGMFILKTANPQGFSDLVFTASIIGALSIIGYGINMSAVAVFQHQKRYDKVVVGQSAAALAGLVLLIIFYRQISQNPNTGVLLAAVILVTSSIVNILTFLFFLKKNRIPVLPKSDLIFWKHILLSSVPFGLTLIFNIIYFRIDTLILAVYKSSFEVGTYGLAYKFFELALTLPAFLMNSLYPDLLLNKQNRDILWKNMEQIFKTLFFLSVPLTVAIWILAPLISTIKTDFADSVGVLRILSLSLPVFYLTGPLMWYFVIMKKQQKLVIIYFFSAIFNLMLNLILIPKYGAIGAAVTTCITELSVLIAGMAALRKIRYAAQLG